MDTTKIFIENNESEYFSVEESMSGYARLLFCGELILDDPACEDLYDEESAECLFNEMIEDLGLNDKERQNTMAKAIEEGFKWDRKMYADNFVDAENHLIENCEHELEYNPLNGGGCDQNYTYVDKTVSGQIFDFANYKAEKKVYFHENNNGTFTPVDWFEIPSDGEERKEYIFVYDTIVYDGRVLDLYDRFC